MKGSTTLGEKVATLIPRMTPVLTADALVCGWNQCSATYTCYICCSPTHCWVEMCEHCYP